MPGNLKLGPGTLYQSHPSQVGKKKAWDKMTHIYGHSLAASQWRTKGFRQTPSQAASRNQAGPIQSGSQ